MLEFKVLRKIAENKRVRKTLLSLDSRKKEIKSNIKIPLVANENKALFIDQKGLLYINSQEKIIEYLTKFRGRFYQLSEHEIKYLDIKLKYPTEVCRLLPEMRKKNLYDIFEKGLEFKTNFR